MLIHRGIKLERIVSLSAAMACFAGGGLPEAKGQEPVQIVPFQLGSVEFAPGDSITIQELRGSSDVLKVGETYSVSGVYTLNSEAEADLSFFTTTTNRNSTLVDPRQTMRVKKGTGSFRLVKTMAEAGYPHLTFYSRSSHQGFGGVYFGQGQWVLHDKHFRYRENQTGGKDAISNKLTSGNEGSLNGPNKVLFEYLGHPVEPPSNLDPAYSKEGLTKALQAAARNGGFSLKRLEIDDSEYPFLVGVVCDPGDYPRLKAGLGGMPEYEFSGGVGGDTCNAINIVPYRAFPPEAGQRIYRRMLLREAVLYEKINLSSKP